MFFSISVHYGLTIRYQPCFIFSFLQVLLQVFFTLSIDLSPIFFAGLSTTNYLTTNAKTIINVDIKSGTNSASFSDCHKSSFPVTTTSRRFFFSRTSSRQLIYIQSVTNLACIYIYTIRHQPCFNMAGRKQVRKQKHPLPSAPTMEDFFDEHIQGPDNETSTHSTTFQSPRKGTRPVKDIMAKFEATMSTNNNTNAIDLTAPTDFSSHPPCGQPIQSSQESDHPQDESQVPDSWEDRDTPPETSGKRRRSVDSEPDEDEQQAKKGNTNSNSDSSSESDNEEDIDVDEDTHEKDDASHEETPISPSSTSSINRTQLTQEESEYRAPQTYTLSKEDLDGLEENTSEGPELRIAEIQNNRPVTPDNIQPSPANKTKKYKITFEPGPRITVFSTIRELSQKHPTLKRLNTRYHKIGNDPLHVETKDPQVIQTIQTINNDPACTTRFIELQPKHQKMIAERVPHDLDLELFRQLPNVLNAQRCQVKRHGQVYDTRKICLTYDGTAPASIKIDFHSQPFDLIKFTPPPLQCFRCQQYGHTAPRCRSLQPICCYCAEHHESKICFQKRGMERPPPKCTNCKGKHMASSKSCKVYQDLVSKQDPTQNQIRSRSTTFQGPQPTRGRSKSGPRRHPSPAPRRPSRSKSGPRRQPPPTPRRPVPAQRKSILRQPAQNTTPLPANQSAAPPIPAPRRHRARTTKDEELKDTIRDNYPEKSQAQIKFESTTYVSKGELREMRYKVPFHLCPHISKGWNESQARIDARKERHARRQARKAAGLLLIPTTTTPGTNTPPPQPESDVASPPPQPESTMTTLPPEPSTSNQEEMTMEVTDPAPPRSTKDTSSNKRKQQDPDLSDEEGSVSKVTAHSKHKLKKVHRKDVTATTTTGPEPQPQPMEPTTQEQFVDALVKTFTELIDRFQPNLKTDLSSIFTLAQCRIINNQNKESS